MQKFVKINGNQYNVKIYLDRNFDYIGLAPNDLQPLKDVAKQMYPKEFVEYEKRAKTQPNTKPNQATKSEKDSDTVSDEGNDSRE